MSEDGGGLPPGLRAAVAADLRPVKPLANPWKRLIVVVPVALAAMSMPLLYFQIRDTTELGMLLGWVPVAIQVLLAFALLVLALREGIPGWRPSATWIFSLCLLAYGVQIVVNLAIFLRSPSTAGGTSFSMWAACFRVESLIGLPILVLVAWLVSRALPRSPWMAGFLAGTGAGLAGDASWRMFCPYAHPAHILMGHTLGILVLALTGFLLGYLWSLQGTRVGTSEA